MNKLSWGHINVNGINLAKDYNELVEAVVQFFSPKKKTQDGKADIANCQS